jgi:hypothetical protein
MVNQKGENMQNTKKKATGKSTLRPAQAFITLTL